MNSQPPHIAILGAGPVGLEAALAAVDHGFPFTLYEAAPRVAGHVREWGHVRLFSPWSLDVSPRMRRRLEAAGHRLPDDDACPTGHELCEKAIDPLASLPEVAPRLELGTRVLEIGREGLLKHEEIGSGERSKRRFRLLLADAEGHERVAHADVVIDCTSNWSVPNALGEGGIAALGERSLDPALISRRIPDCVADADAWAGKTVLLIGAGYSAQTAACDLAELAERTPDTRVVWAMRSPDPDWHIDPNDPLPERSRLSSRAKAVAEGASPAVHALTGVTVEAVAATAGGEGVKTTLRRDDGDVMEIEADRILALTGAVGDHRIYRQLQVHECYATSGPMKLAAALLGAGSADCMDQESQGPDTLVNPEPGFFIIGSKSYGRNNTFLMRVGWQQVEEVFSVIS